MKDIVIIGTENIGQEVVKIIEAINSKRNTWNILGFISLKKMKKEVMLRDTVFLDL